MSEEVVVDYSYMNRAGTEASKLRCGTEWVPIGTPPEKSGWYCVFTPNRIGGIKHHLSYFDRGIRWWTGPHQRPGTNPITHWLPWPDDPIAVPESDDEAAARLVEMPKEDEE